VNPFAILGVENNSSLEICKKSYRKLAMRHHPDKGGDASSFQKIQAAWELIEGGYKIFINEPKKSSFSQQSTSYKPEEKLVYINIKPPIVETLSGKHFLRFSLSENQMRQGGIIVISLFGKFTEYILPRNSQYCVNKTITLEQKFDMIGINNTKIVDVSLSISKDKVEDFSDLLSKIFTVTVNPIIFMVGDTLFLQEYNLKVIIPIAFQYDPTVRYQLLNTTDGRKIKIKFLLEIKHPIHFNDFDKALAKKLLYETNFT
jgi:preprotein translocase subunit Sec63